MRWLMLVLLLFAQPGFAALIEGRVVDGENPVRGIQVAAYPSLDPH